MEEIRELLYELIKTNFSSGVMVEHLAKVYKESYETAGLGPKLPENWLDHIRAAEEFEVVNRGAIVMLYTRQRGGSLPMVDMAMSSLNISKENAAASQSREMSRIRLTDRELARQVLNVEKGFLQAGRLDGTPDCDRSLMLLRLDPNSYNMKSILAFEPMVCPCTKSVIVVGCTDDVSNISVQLAGTRNNFQLLRSAMDAFYGADKFAESVCEPELGGIYAVKHTDKHWYRALFKVPDVLTLIDIGASMPLDGATVRKLRAEYALSRIYPIYAFTVSLANDAQTRSSFRVFRTACHTLLPLAVLPAVSNYSLPAPELVHLTAMELSDMPKCKFDAHVLSVFDPDNISIRQCSLDPIPDYIASAVKRDSLAQASPPAFSELIPGRFFAAKLHPSSSWERVQLLGASTVDADCFRVYAVDLGLHGVARKANIRHLRIPRDLRKIMMAKCKIAGIAPSNGYQRWSNDAQTKFCDLLYGVATVEVVPIKEWEMITEPGCAPIPMIHAQVLVNDCDLAQSLLTYGCARAI